MAIVVRTRKSGSVAALLLGLLFAPHAQADAGYAISTPSAPTGFVTGDTVQVNITGPSTALILRSALTRNGQTVTSAVQPDGNAGSMTGIVSGLQIGPNTFQLFTAKTSKVPVAQIIVTRAVVPAIACNSNSITVPSGLTVPNVIIKSAVLNAASGNLPAHCLVDGAINQRTGVDGLPYAINFRLRMPTAWNERFYMGGGSGTDGTVVDPTAVLPQGFATIGTDSGHSNTLDNNPNAGGTGSFGVDPQARVDFGYNSYDQVTQVGKALVAAYYGLAPFKSYFQGCSEGGREAVLMSQRFPHHYDGIIAGDPVIHLPLGPMNGVFTSQIFAGLATRSGLFLANGDPALNKTYTDPDLFLVRNAILSVCDNLDGLVDGMVNNLPACTAAVVHPALTALTCTGAKTAACLTADQIASLEKAFNGPTGVGLTNSNGDVLYPNWPWDAGVSGQSGATFNPNWRSWWLGSFNSATNNATKFSFVGVLAVAYTTPPVLPFTSANILPFVLNFNFDTDPPKIISATSGIYTESGGSLYFTLATDLSAFNNRGSKMMIYHGGSDSSVSLNDTIHWYSAMDTFMGGTARNFARLFPVPGMNHCSGGPATDNFNMLPQIMNWVENGVAPDSVLATASTPGFFGVAARSRPLCPYPKQVRYNGSGDINVAANFHCE